MVADKDDDEAPTISAPSRIRIEPIHEAELQTVNIEPKKAKSSKDEPVAEPEPPKEETDSKEPSPAVEPIIPSAPEVTKDTAEPPAAAEKTPEPVEDAPEPAATEPDEPEPATESEEVPTQNTTKDGTKETDSDIVAQKEQERAAELQKLAASHKYLLPINQIEKRRNKRAVWFGALIIILLCVAWVDVALDANLVTIPGVHAPTHFFHK